MKIALRHIVLPLTPFTLELDVELDNRVTAIFGPSGAGKTSVLELIAGLRRARHGQIRLGETVVLDQGQRVNLAPRERRIGYVPQDLALFPHLSVRRNLLYGQRSEAEAHPLCALEHVIKVLELEPLWERGTVLLSGGERQRVALGRALLSSPRLLLLDEPLSSLDAKLRNQILPFLERVRNEFPIPIIYVTHNVEEVRSLGEHVLVMDQGKVVQRGTPTEVFASSSTPPELSVKS